MVYRVFAILLIFSFGIQEASQAQQILPASEYVKWQTSVSNTSVSSGSEFTVQLDATIAAPWKLYAMNSPTPSWGAKLELDPLPAGFTQVGEIEQSKPKNDYDPNFKMDVFYFKDEASMSVHFGVDENAANGFQVLSGKVAYQICNDDLGICLPPTREVFTAQLDVVAEGSGPSTPIQNQDNEGEQNELNPESAVLSSVDIGNNAPSFVPDDEPEIIVDNEEPVVASVGASSNSSSTSSKGLGGFILLAIGAGLGALLMPCVFPMIPLTVSYFTKHSQNRGQAFRLAGVYGLSIIVIFTGLGVLAALLLGASGAQLIAANPWVNLFIGLTFIVFALSLLGLFELQLPQSWVNYFGQQSNEKQGYAGVLFMGGTLTLVSFSCTAPFVGGLLAATAGGEWTYPIIGMLVFSATFALPFVLFALFPSGLSRLPKSGSWMNTLKVVFGFIELAAAIKFLSNADLVWGWGIISRPMAIAVTVVIFFLTGLYLIGKLRLSHDPPVETIGTVRLMFAISFFGLSLYMVPGLFGAPLNNLDAFLPPRQGTDMSLVASLGSVSNRADVFNDEDWFENVGEAYAEAAAVNKPVFIDFTGYTCTNCRQMESTVFPHLSVAEQFDQKYVLLRLYTDDLDEGPALQKFQLELTGTVALPTYAIVNPVSGVVLSQRSGISSVNDFADFLDTGADMYFEQALASTSD